MKTLAEFKRKLAAAMQTGQLIGVRKGETGIATIDRGSIPVCAIKSHAFALKRKNESWVEFGKAADWSFTDTTAILRCYGGLMEFKFQPLSQ